MKVVYPNFIVEHWQSLHQMIEENYAHEYNRNHLVLMAVHHMAIKHQKPLQEYTEQMGEIDRTIAYQLEPIDSVDHCWSADVLLQSITQPNIDEVWDLDIDNVEYWRTLGVETLFKPVMYTHSWKFDIECEKTIDVLFYGTFFYNGRRLKYLRDISEYLLTKGINFVYCSHITGNLLNKFVAQSKIILDISHINNLENRMQRQTRIAPLLMNNKCVVSERSRRNYYGDLIIEADIEDIPNTLVDTIKSGRWSETRGHSEKFKNLFR